MLQKQKVTTYEIPADFHDAVICGWLKEGCFFLGRIKFSTSPLTATIIMHHSLKFIPYALFFCISLIAVNQLFAFIKINYPEAVSWSSDAPAQPLLFEDLGKLGPFMELTADSADSIVEVQSLFSSTGENTKNISLLVAFRSSTCPVARNYARSLQSLVKAYPNIDFIAVLPNPEDVESFKESSWEEGRVMVDPSLSLWDFIWYILC